MIWIRNKFYFLPFQLISVDFKLQQILYQSPLHFDNWRRNCMINSRNLSLNSIYFTIVHHKIDVYLQKWLKINISLLIISTQSSPILSIHRIFFSYSSIYRSVRYFKFIYFVVDIFPVRTFFLQLIFIGLSECLRHVCENFSFNRRGFFD